MIPPHFSFLLNGWEEAQFHLTNFNRTLFPWKLSFLNPFLSIKIKTNHYCCYLMIDRKTPNSKKNHASKTLRGLLAHIFTMTITFNGTHFLFLLHFDAKPIKIGNKSILPNAWWLGDPWLLALFPFCACYWYFSKTVKGMHLSLIFTYFVTLTYYSFIAACLLLVSSFLNTLDKN